MKSEGGKFDYGWKLQGQAVGICEDRSLLIDETTHDMISALRQMSMEYYVIDRCLQCGICTSACPNTLLMSNGTFSPRTFIQRARLGLIDLDGEELWMCTHCGSCRMVCPFDIPFLDVMTSLRNLVVAHGAGYVPTSIRHALSSIATCGNPWQEDYAGRVKWLKDAGIQGLSQTDDTEVLLFLGCLPGYDQRARKAAESTLCLLQRMGKRVTVLAADEVCCGDTARRVGGTDTFEQVRQTNKNLIAREGIRDVYTLSPHCREGLKMSCRGDEDSIRVSSVLELFNEEYKNGNLCMQGIPPARVTFHDPCFLSKHDAFVQQPRDLLNGIPGVDLVEMAHHGRKSLCCGGGGGGAWRDTKKGERLAEIRLDEAVATGAEILVTACPYCLSMLDAARAGDKKYECLEIMDIGELLWKGVTA